MIFCFRYSIVDWSSSSSVYLDVVKYFLFCNIHSQVNRRRQMLLVPAPLRLSSSSTVSFSLPYSPGFSSGPGVVVVVRRRVPLRRRRTSGPLLLRGSASPPTALRPASRQRRLCRMGRRRRADQRLLESRILRRFNENLFMAQTFDSLQLTVLEISFVCPGFKFSVDWNCFSFQGTEFIDLDEICYYYLWILYEFLHDVGLLLLRFAP